MNIYLYEDKNYKDFFPLTLMHPVYSLTAGFISLPSKISSRFKVNQIGLISREAIVSLVSKDFPEYPVNIVKKSENGVLFINGRIKDFGDLPLQIENVKNSTVYESKDDGTAAVFFGKSISDELSDLCTQDEYSSVFEKADEEFQTQLTTATMYNFCWDYVSNIKNAISSDFSEIGANLKISTNLKVHDGVNMINENDIFLGNGVTVYPSATLDASAGPIFIGENCKIESMAAIYGPCHIGDNSVVLAGKLVHSSIGHSCRVGGEVEKSIFAPYVNKYHSGFIGHSYVGSWVNFGALTTNSDLKNNYSNIKVVLNSEEIATGMMKVGSFIGDYCKFGIGSLLNTGINIGVSCNIFGGQLTLDKEVPSFRWGNSGKFKEYDLAKAIETAKIAMARRRVKLTSSEIELLTSIHQGNNDERGVVNF